MAWRGVAWCVMRRVQGARRVTDEAWQLQAACSAAPAHTCRGQADAMLTTTTTRPAYLDSETGCSFSSALKLYADDADAPTSLAAAAGCDAPASRPARPRCVASAAGVSAAAPTHTRQAGAALSCPSQQRGEGGKTHLAGSGRPLSQPQCPPAHRGASLPAWRHDERPWRRPRAQVLLPTSWDASAEAV